MKFLRNIFVAASVAAVALCASAQTAQQELTIDPKRSASNHAVYPYPAKPLPVLTPAPSGYEPFYMNHYGRHGSRWLTQERYYSAPVKQLKKAERAGVLNADGKQLLATLQMIQAEAKGRAGELTDVGAAQHQGIAERMYKNFPQIFAGDAPVDARSTIVIRCILSMTNAVTTLKALNPKLRVTTDASEYDMHYMGWGKGQDTLANPLRNRMRPLSDSINAADTHPERFVAGLFTDAKWAADSLNCKKLMRDVFDIAGSLQNVGKLADVDLYKYFTTSEIYDLWRMKNIYWYTQWGNNPQGGNRMPYIERELLENIIATADSVIACGGRGASLRFGHETCVLPLASLIGIDDVAYSEHDLNQLHEHWQDFRIFPMACNVQMVLYRNKKGGDVLVKVLYNEHEAKLPVATTMAPYYRWTDVRAYLEQVLSRKIDWNN